MSFQTRQITYFDNPGPENTEKCIEIAKDIVNEKKIHHVIAATTSGSSGVAFAQAFADAQINLVVVTHSAGFLKPNDNELTREAEEKIKALGAKLLTCTILTHSIETSFISKFGGVMPTHIIAHSLRRFGEGAKVACEIVMEACDAGAIPEGIPVIAVGGTGRGSDTVLVIRSTASKRFLELKVLGVLAMPSEW